MEKTNIRYVTSEQIPEKIDFASVDVSFISLTKVLLPIRNYLTENGQIVALIKPQFEAGREDVGKKGIVKDAKIHQRVIENVISYANECQFSIQNLTYSPITGGEGNIEFLAHFKVGGTNSLLQVEQVVQEAHDCFKG